MTVSAKEMAATTRWVEALNKLAREMDERAASMHPSAVREALAPDRERYHALAARGPE